MKYHTKKLEQEKNEEIEIFSEKIYIMQDKIEKVEAETLKKKEALNA